MSPDEITRSFRGRYQPTGGSSNYDPSDLASITSSWNKKFTTVKVDPSKSQKAGGLNRLDEKQLASLGYKPSDIADWNDLPERQQKKLEDVLIGIASKSSPTLSPGYKPGSLPNNNVINQDLSTRSGLKQALPTAARENAGGLAEFLAGNTIRLGKTAALLPEYSTQASIQAARPLIDALGFKDQADAQARVAQAKINKLQPESLYTKETQKDLNSKDLQKANQAFAKTVFKGGVGAGSEIAPMLAGGSLAGLGIKEAAGLLAKTSALSAATNVGSGYANGNYDNLSATDRAKAIGLDAAMGAATEAGTYGAGRLLKKVTGAGGTKIVTELADVKTPQAVQASLAKNGLGELGDVSKQLAKTSDQREIKTILTKAAQEKDRAVYELAPASLEKAMTSPQVAGGVIQKEGKDIVGKLPNPIQKLVSAVGDAKDKAAYHLYNNMQYIDKHFKGATDAYTGRKVNEVVREMTGNVRQYAGIAQSRREQNQAFQELGKLARGLEDRRGSARKAFKEDIVPFIQQKQDALNRQKLGEKVVIPKGTAEQEAAYDLLNKSTKSEVQYAFDNNLIDEVKYKAWMADDNYTRVQREMEDTLSGGAGGGAEASIGSTVTSQKLKGSDKDALDPIAAYIDWSNRITRESEVNKLATYVTKQLESVGEATVRRDADKVIERMNLYGDAALLRPVRNKLGKLLSSQNKFATTIQREIDQLNKAGLSRALKKEAPETLAGTLTKSPNSRETKKLINELIVMSDSELENIKRKIGRRDIKLATALDELTNIRKQYIEVKTDVADIIGRARELADDPSKSNTSLARFNQGIKEIVETDPMVVKSIKDMDAVMLGAINKYVNFPGRVLKAGATAYNPAFIAANFIKDQITSFNLSKHALATHNPIAFWEGLKESIVKPTARSVAGKVGYKDAFKPSELFEEYMKKNKNMTTADLARELKSATRQGYEELGLKGDSFLRKAEGIMTSTETATRYQNFIGTYKRELKKGVDPQEALKRANQAGRENSVDFSQRGEASGFMRIFNPYLPAQIQGGRSLARAFKERPAGTSAKIAATVLAPVSAATYYNLSDPERAKLYAEIPEYERNSNLIMMLPGRGYIKVPLPPGISNMAKPLRNLIESEYLGDRQGFLETAKNLLVDPFNPLGTSKNEVLGNFVPQSIKPAVQIATNTDLFTGNKIISDKLLENKKPSEQFYDSTSQSYRDIGKLLGVSPLQVKSVVKGYAAGGGEQVFENVDQARKLAGQDVATGGRSTLEQVLGRFYAQKPSGNAVTGRFYDDLKATTLGKQDVSDAITEATKRGDDGLARTLIGEFNSKIDNLERTYKTTYGKYDNNSELLDALQKNKFKDSDKALKSRRK